MTLKLTGTILNISEPQKVSENLTKKTLVIKTDENYPQDVAFELVNKNLGLANDYNTGDSISVCFNVRGREWKGKYYTSLTAWKIEPHETEVTNVQQNPARQEVETDLPF